MNTQTKVKHTPGPWTFKEMFQSRGDKMTYEIIGGAIKQDAILMSMAPEMLEMLYTVIPSVEEADEFNKPSKKLGPLVWALISKAEGRI